MKAKRYKLSTGLAEVIEQPKWKSDKAAWEYLRKKFKTSKYATLYRQELIVVPIVNLDEYVERFNAKYTTQKIGKTYNDTYWVPVLRGITSHSYRNVK